MDASPRVRRENLRTTEQTIHSGRSPKERVLTLREDSGEPAVFRCAESAGTTVAMAVLTSAIATVHWG